MSRIRTVKPEFWTNEQIMECSPIARLLFIGLWNFCDDGGNHPASSKTLKAEVFPGDAINQADVQALIDELIAQRLIGEYEAEGKRYWHVTGWHHQKIDRPTFKYPVFENLPIIDDGSKNTRRVVADQSPPEGKGEEGKGEESKGLKPIAASKADRPECPHQEIIDIYHEVLPMGTQVRVWTDQRKGKLRARWREDTKRQNLDWWRRLFVFIAESKFLTGRTNTKDRAPFVITLDWIITSEKMVKIIEGEYHREYSA